MKTIIEFIKIYFTFIYEIFIYNDLSTLNKVGRFFIKPAYWVSFGYWYILSIIFSPFFIFFMINYDKIKDLEETSATMINELFNSN